MAPARVLQQGALDLGPVRRRRDAAPQPRARERWHAGWLRGQGWMQVQVAAALERDAHTIGAWLEALRRRGPAGLQDEA